MSKLARKPIQIPAGVTVQVEDAAVSVRGPRGELRVPLLPYLTITPAANGIVVTRADENRQARANCGTMASLLKNAIRGTTELFTRALEIEGVGFKAALEGKTLKLNVGFTHPVFFPVPGDIQISIEKGVIRISGMDRQRVGETAASIRRIAPPEPYKGKGIRYQGEHIRRKAGKKVAGASAGGGT